MLIGGTIIWLLDRQEYEHLTEAFWYTLQTITTVGYGDVTPARTHRPARRSRDHVARDRLPQHPDRDDHVIVHRCARSRAASPQASDDDAAQARLEIRLDALIDRLDRLEELVRANGGADCVPADKL